MPVADGVPVMAPVEELIDSPTGRPVAVQVMVAPDWVSTAVGVTVVVGVPDVLLWSPELEAMTPLVTVQVKLVEPEKPDSSVAVRVTG